MAEQSEPLYRSIAKDLLQKIESEFYVKGDILPTEAKLGLIYNVSRVTIRQAIRLLVEENYVKKVQGSGTHVIYSKQMQTLDRSAKIIAFSDEMRLLGKTPSAKIIAFQLTQANHVLAKELNIEEGSSIFFYERMLYGDNFPYCFEQGFMPVAYFPDLTIAHLEASKISYVEQTKQLPIDYSHQVVHATLADEKKSRLLQVPVNAPLLEVTHITYDIEDQAIMKTKVSFDSSQYQAHFIKQRI
jgi:DNA-binding GntR family transcriptional regulator